MKNKNSMSASEHLRELRNRILVTVGALVLICALVFCYSGTIMRYLFGIAQRSGFSLMYVAPQEAVVQELRVLLTIAIFTVMPIAVYEAVCFVIPAFTSRVTVRRFRVYALCAVCMFCIGVAFALLIATPITMSFLHDFSVREGITVRISVEKYVSLFLTIVICLGVMFETPIVSVALTSTGVLRVEQLRKRQAVSVYCVLTAVISAVLTPPDPVTMIVMLVPMWALYPVSIIMCKLFGKERCRNEADEGTKATEKRDS